MSDSSKPSNKDNSPTSSTDDFSRQISRIAVSQICEAAEFNGANLSAIDSFSEILIRFITEIGKSAHFYSELASRTSCNEFDVIQALEDLSSSHGFTSASDNGRCLLKSGVLQEIKEFVELEKETPFARSIPKYPIKSKASNKILSFAQLGEDSGKNHIPNWLPAFPDPHTYVQTPVWNEREINARDAKVEQAKLRRKGEKSLLSLQKRLASCDGASEFNNAVVESGNEKGKNVVAESSSYGQTDKVRCYEPATMKYLGYFPALTPDEVKEHVAQARKAQKTWAKSSFRQRRQFLRVLLKYIIEHQDLICEVSSRDTGKTMVDASLGEIMTTCEKIHWLLDEGEKWLKPEYRSSGRSMLHKRAKVEFYPLGVIGAIVSWNYPFHNIFNPMLAAVFSGNGAVIKVSENASWSGCFYLRIIQAALATVGAPENLVHVITGFAETGQALVSSVDKIIFVGSPGVGKMIMQKASETLIPVTLELGGKDAFIVCEDVDVPHVVQIATRAALQSSGQNCAGAERFYVHKDIYSTFVAQLVKVVKSVSVGPPLAGRYDMGAICMQEHADKLQSLVNDALEKGAEIAGRGIFGHLGEDAVDQFFPPTVLTNVDHTMKIMQEEAFGPLIPIMQFSSDEEVVKLANDSKYGLGCAVFSGNQKHSRAIASQLHCGVAAINDFASNYMCQSLPFGGVKDSGFGRFAGVEGLRSCCLAKSVVEDRFWPYIKTTIPKPIQYPIAENGFEFQQSLVELLYGMNIYDRVRALLNVVKILKDKDAPSTMEKRRH